MGLIFDYVWYQMCCYSAPNVIEPVGDCNIFVGLLLLYCILVLVCYARVAEQVITIYQRR